MKHICKKSVAVLAISLASTAAMATPNVAPKCEANFNISNPASSPATPYYFNDSCSTVYVAPPESGTVRLTSFLEHVNLGSCGALKKAQSAADSRVDLIDSLQGRLNSILEDFLNTDSAWYAAFNQAKASLQSAKEVKALAEADQDNAIAEQVFWSEAKNEAFVEFSLCKDDYDLQSLTGGTTDTLQQYCSEQIQDYLNANSSYRNALIAKLRADQAYNTANAKYNSASSVVDDYNDEIIAVSSRASSIEAVIVQQRATMQSIFTEYAQMYGGIGNITYASNWGRLVNDYQSANARSNLSFTKLPIDRAFVLISNDDRFVEPSEALAERSGVLNVSIPLLNLTNYGISDMPAGVNPNEGRLQSGLPDTFSGSAEFALALGCSIKENGKSDFANFVSVATNFEYTLKARGGYTATYDKKSFLEVIKKVASKNSWFFKRKTVRETSIEENNEIDFSIEFFADAEGFEFSKEEKDAITSSVKERLLIDVLDSVGVRVGANTAEAELPEPSVGSQMGTRLVSTCRYGGSWMCYGGWVLVGLDGLFGQREAENRFRQENRTTATETFTDTFFVKKWGSLSYGS